MFKRISSPKGYSIGLLISFIICCVFIIIYIFRDNEDIYLFTRDLVVIYVFTIIIIIKKQTRWTSSILLFLCTFIVFYLSRPIASYIDIKYIIDSNKYIFYSFSEETITSIFCLLGISISSIAIGYMISYCINRPSRIVKPISLNHIQGNKRLKRIITIAIIFTIPGTIFKSLFDLYLVIQYGYMIIYMELPETAPSWARISWGAFSIIFPMLLLFCNNKKYFFKIVIFYLSINLFSFLKGTRGELIMPIIYFLWFYYSNFSKRDLSIKKILFLVIIFAIIASVMLTTRGADFSFDISLILEMLFLTQGVQYVFMGNYWDYQNQFQLKSRWYILYPLIAQFCWFFNPLYRKGKTASLANDTLSLDDQLMYAINPDAYFAGAGYGSSYIAELDALGGIPMIIIGSLLLGYIINWFEVKYKTNKYLIILSWFWIPSLIWKPRGNFFISLFIPLLTIIMFWIFEKLSCTICNKHSHIKSVANELH